MSDNKNISKILLVCALIFAAMLPLRNAVYSDDVAFGQSVRHLLQTGDLKVSEYHATSSISHIIWGFLFTKILGFSFTSLNISVIVLLPILLLGFYKLLRIIEIPPDKSFFLTLFFLSTPWIPFLTYTFMSDIPFLTLEVLSLLFFLKYQKLKNPNNLIISVAFAALAFLMRQLGLAIILGQIAGVLLDRKIFIKNIKPVFFSALILAVTIIGYFAWLSIPGNQTIPQYYYEDQTKNAIENFLPFTNISVNTRTINLSEFMHRSINYANQAMGLLFPLILVFVLSNIKLVKQIAKRNYKIIIFSTIIAGLLYIPDVIIFRKDYTAGFPLNEYEYESLLPIPWAHIWKFLVVASIPFWSALLAKTIINGTKKAGKQQIYLLITFLGMLFMTVITFQSWDRYLIPLLPFIFIILARATYKFRLNKILTIITVTVLLIDSVQMTKLRYDEAGLLYNIGNQIVASGVEPSTIDLNRDQGWDLWFYYEKGIQQKIREAGGDKTKINFQKHPLPKKNIKYGIYTDRMIKYQNLNIDYSKATVIPFRSLFVSSKFTFVNY